MYFDYSINLVYHKCVSSWHVILLLSSKPLNLARRKWSLGYNRYGLQGPDVHQDGLARVQILELWQNNIWIILGNFTKKCLKRRKKNTSKICCWLIKNYQFGWMYEKNQIEKFQTQRRYNRQFLKPISNMNFSFLAMWAAQGSKGKFFKYERVCYFSWLFFHS